MTKRAKAAAAKRRAARAKLRHKKAVARMPVRYTIAAPLPNTRYTVVSDTPTDYRGPVTGETNSTVGEFDPSKPSKPISGGVLNGKAIRLPTPAYPPAARAVRAGGAVSVQVLIDENGYVISAAAVSGNPLLRGAAVEAARGAQFSRTKLSGHPVKVQGIITYNFVP
jgi:TonB family protein